MSFFEAFEYTAALLILVIFFFLIIYLALKIRQIFLMLDDIGNARNQTPKLPLEPLDPMEGKDPS